MASPKAPVGELGAMQVTRRASGLFWARGRVRDDGDTVHQLQVVGQTEDEARTELRHKALTLTTGGPNDLSPSSTIAEAGRAWLGHVKTRAMTGSLAYSTCESTLRLILVPRCGAITLGSLTVGRCDRIVQGLLIDGSLSKARRARSVLSLICGYAVRNDAMSLNPVRDVQHLPVQRGRPLC